MIPVCGAQCQLFTTIMSAVCSPCRRSHTPVSATQCLPLHTDLQYESLTCCYRVATATRADKGAASAPEVRYTLCIGARVNRMLRQRALSGSTGTKADRALKIFMQNWPICAWHVVK